MNSLLYFHPEVKNRIVVFDDNSTDGTKEWLQANSIKRITWSGKYNRYTDNYTQRFGTCMSYWNDIMIKDICDQVYTKYILINDGDVVFTDKFLNNYSELININNRKALLVISNFMDELYNRKPFCDTVDAKNLQDKYKIILNQHQNKLHRVHIFHGLLDLDYFKNNNIVFDTIDDKNYINMIAPIPIVDGGVDFYYQLLVNNIEYYTLPYWKDINSFHVYHYGFRSSLAKGDTLNINFDNTKNELEQKFNSEYIQNPKLKNILNILDKNR